MNEISDNETIDPERSFDNLPIYKKQIILFAGPLMNLIIPFLLFPLIFINGIDSPKYLEDKMVIGSINIEDSRFNEFKLDSEFISINDIKINDTAVGASTNSSAAAKAVSINAISATTNVTASGNNLVTITVNNSQSSTAASNISINGNAINFYYEKRIQDAGAYTNATDVPYRFVPCMVAGLTYYLSMKYAAPRIQELKLIYEDELARALEEDGSSSSVYIAPRTYYPSI